MTAGWFGGVVYRSEDVECATPRVRLDKLVDLLWRTTCEVISRRHPELSDEDVKNRAASLLLESCGPWDD